MAFIFDEEMKFLKTKEQFVKNTGIRDGVDERPATPTESLNDSQLEIKFDCERVVRSLIEETQKQILDYSGQLDTHASVLRDNAILPNDENIINETKLEFHDYLGQKEKVYIDTNFEFLKADKELKKFKLERGISVDADAPDSKLAHYLMIAAWTVCESIVNIAIFNDGFGVLDATFLSISISLINIIPAVFVGNYFRYTNSDDSTMKHKAHFAAILWLLFLIWINTAVAIYRSGVLSDPGLDNTVLNANHAKIFFDSALSVFTLHIPPINDIVSIFLWLGGIMFGLIACWKGYTSDDKVPGYGKISVTKDEAQTNLNNLMNELNSQVECIKKNSKIKFDTVRDVLQANLRNYKAASNLLMTKILSYQRQMKEVQNQFIYLMNCYRDANKSVRHSKPPTYFESELDLTLGINNELPEFSNYEEEKIKIKINELEALYNQKIVELNSRQKKFNQYCEELNKFYAEKITQWDLSAKAKYERDF